MPSLTVCKVLLKVWVKRDVKAAITEFFKKMSLQQRTLILHFEDNDTNIAGLINKQWLLTAKGVYFLEAAEAVNQADIT